MGVRNLLATTGRPVASGDEPAEASQLEVDAVGLMKVIRRLNEGRDVADEPLGESTQFVVGAAVNPFASDPDAEWRRLDRKIEAGADFILTPPVLDPDAFEPVLDRLRATGRPILAGVALLESARHAELLSSEVVGARASEAVLHRLRSASDQTQEAARITAEIMAWLRTRVQGLVVTWWHGTARTAEDALSGVAYE
jgi:homocysteine S-methyltransferase